MGQRIPEETVEHIRRSVDIVDIIQQYVSLKKQGRNYFGLCPFHGEKTPSFSVSPEKQIYHCFGCGAGGNVFSFLMEIEGITFIEAVKRLAPRANVDLSDVVDDHPSAKRTETAVMVAAHELLKKFYHHLLMHTNEGEEALNYLLQRGFTLEIIEQFEIGYALPSWDAAVTFLANKGFSLPLMERAGLIAKKSGEESYFDRFRHRIMFPIHNHQGETVAFSGRTLGNEDPKYVNSPETPIFNKRNILYHFHEARLPMRQKQQVVLLEGFADVIAAVRAGITHAVATMGTALSEEQARMLRRNASSVIVCYDGDRAGIDAALRASETLVEAGCYVKVAMMPDGLDPDEYVRRYGADRFRHHVLDASLSLTAFKLEYLKRGRHLQNESERLRYIEEAVKEISRLSNAIEADYYLRQLADEFSISMDALREQMAVYGKKQQVERKKEHRETVLPPTKSKLLPAFQKAERMLIAHMLRDKTIAFTVQQAIEGAFNIEEHRAIVAYVYAFYEEGHEPDVSSLLERIHDPQLKRTVTELAMMPINENISSAELQDYIQCVLNYPQEQLLKQKEAQLREAERQKDYERAKRIASEIIALRKSLHFGRRGING
ncbi:DNA primase [Anoxybacillus sp. ST4]|uniref:DNA primase n=1 Tax=Anoxybacillus sp. ST4 TaxID=2864181 RepID=UPI001C63DE0A|nr:DNA primase [Anoxybacillus sp. ST4]MBW7649868.1 DNA primase [Anoxybacillus sp. ST4]